MKNQEIILNSVQKSFETIGFLKRYRQLFLKYGYLENMMTRMDKSKNLRILRDLGYPFKIFNPGQYYNLQERIGNIGFKLSIKINKGFITTYIYIYINDEKLPLEHNNFAFIYRQLLDNMEAEAKIFTFKSYDELKEIASSLLQIYEDFKAEFLSRINGK